MQSLIQKERKAHNEDTAKANRKILLPEKTYKTLEKKAKAEGKTANEKATEIIKQRAKDVFEGKINKYGFLHIEKALYEALGWRKVKTLKSR